MIGMSLRIRVLTLILISAFFSLGHPFAKQAFASFFPVERPEDELLILELHVNEKLRRRALLGYLSENSDLRSALLPLSSLSRALSYAIKVDTAAGIAQGWFLQENNVFQLDLNRQTVLLKGQEQNLPKGAAEAHYEDIYVQARFIEDWFDLDIKIDISTLQIDVNSKTTLPYEEEAERLKRAKAFENRQKGVRPDYSSARLLPYKRFSFPSAIFQQSLQAQRSSGDNRFQSSYSVQTAGDVLGFGTRFVLSGVADKDEGHELQTAQLTFQRRDPDKNLLGPLQAGSVSFGDIDFPDVPLIVSRKRGRGFAASSDSRLGTERSFGPEETIVDGDAPIGWDAELYRNGYFVAFQEIGSDGRYSFENVELIRGFNLFKIVLYGPEGQKRTETKRVIRGAQMLREGENAYEFALGQPDADFLPITQNAETDSSFGASGRLFYGFRKYLTLGASVFRGSDATSTLEDNQSAATLSAITAFLGFRTQLQLTRGSEGRRAHDIETTTRFAGANITLGHTVFKGFNVDDRKLKERTSANLSRNFGAFSASVRAEKRNFLDQESETFIDTTLSTKIFGIELTNSLERTFSETEALENFDGDLAAAFNLWDWRIRSNFIYDLEPEAQRRMESIRLSGFKTLNEKDTLRLNMNRDFNLGRTTADARYTKQFDDFSLDFNLGGSSDQNYFTGVTLRTALQADHNNKYNFVNAKDGGLGAVGLRAYVDANENKIYEEGEALLENVSFRYNRGLIEDATDEEGTVFVKGLSESVTRFTIDESGLPSIYLKPAVDYVDVIPRSGTTGTIDMAFTQLGEIDGYVFRSEKTAEGQAQPAPAQEILLIDGNIGEELQTAQTAYDGYYIFSAIPLGPYQLKVAPLWDEDENTLPSQNVVLTHEEPVLFNVDMVLPPKVPHTVEQVSLLPEAALKTVSAEKDQSGLYIHTGSFSTHASAEYQAAHLKTLYGDILQDIVFTIREVQVKSKTYYRVLGIVSDRKEGRRLCRALTEKKILSGCNVLEM